MTMHLEVGLPGAELQDMQSPECSSRAEHAALKLVSSPKDCAQAPDALHCVSSPAVLGS